MAKKAFVKPKTKLTISQKKLASKYIQEEMETGKYPRKQAIAIGISRAAHSKKKSKKTTRK